MVTTKEKEAPDKAETHKAAVVDQPMETPRTAAVRKTADRLTAEVVEAAVIHPPASRAKSHAATAAATAVPNSALPTNACARPIQSAVRARYATTPTVVWKAV